MRRCPPVNKIEKLRLTHFNNNKKWYHQPAKPTSIMSRLRNETTFVPVDGHYYNAQNMLPAHITRIMWKSRHQWDGEKVSVFLFLRGMQ